MRPGDAFIFIGDGRDPGKHLWLVLSDPQQDAERVVIVSIISATKNCNRDCVLTVKDHNRLRWESVAAYHFTSIISLAELLDKEKRGLLERKTPFYNRVLGLVRACAANSKMEKDAKGILRSQGLLVE